MATDRTVPPFHPMQRDALFADARRRALRRRQAALRLVWARLGGLMRPWVHRPLPATPPTPSLPQHKAC